VQPGVCGEATITATHLLVAKDAGIYLGSESNAALDEIRSVAARAGLRFIVNTICSGSGHVTGLVAGDPVSAHKKAIEKAKCLFGVVMPKCDVLVVSAYPEESNLWQAFKALYSAHLVVRRGGRIILVCRAEEGVGEHPDLIPLMSLGTEKLQQIIQESRKGDMLCVAAAFAGSQVMEHARIDLVSGNLDIGKQVHPYMGYYSSLQNAVNNACTHLEKGQTIRVLREGPIALPIAENC
jgi:nickel-dependent lactate racemase